MSAIDDYLKALLEEEEFVSMYNDDNLYTVDPIYTAIASRMENPSKRIILHTASLWQYRVIVCTDLISPVRALDWMNYGYMKNLRKRFVRYLASHETPLGKNLPFPGEIKERILYAAYDKSGGFTMDLIKQSNQDRTYGKLRVNLLYIQAKDKLIEVDEPAYQKLDSASYCDISDNGMGDVHAYFNDDEDSDYGN